MSLPLIPASGIQFHIYSQGCNYLSLPLISGSDTHRSTCVKWGPERSLLTYIRGQGSVYELNQWKMMLQCNIISHWLSPYPEFSLYMTFCHQFINFKLEWVFSAWISSHIPHQCDVNNYFYMAHKPGVGVTKALFFNFSISKIFHLSKVTVKMVESHLYLTGVTTDELRWHLTNINVIFNSYNVLDDAENFFEMLEPRKLA